MSNTTKTGGPAFPADAQDGMTLRDYFAAKAMQAAYKAYMDEMRKDENSEMFRGDWESDIATFSYMMADAMLLERKEK